MNTQAWFNKFKYALFPSRSFSTIYLYIIALMFVVFGFAVQPLNELVVGLWHILTSPSNLITDYFEVGGVGATFVNAGLLMFINIFVVSRNTTRITGPLTAALFTVMGFAFFGKNLFNTFPITFGSWLYSRYRREPFSKVLLTALFATTLAPVVSIISFGQDIRLWLSIPLGIGAGIVIGFIIAPIASSFLRFHQGFSLYNVGFTAGVIGMIFASIMRVFDLPVTYDLLGESQNQYGVIPFFVVLSLFFLISGLFLEDWSIENLKELNQESGRLISDFVTDYGAGTTLVNMGALGLLSIIYITLVNGKMNGAVIGGMLTVVGFAAFGKHLRNVVPIVFGVFIMQVLMAVDNPSSTSSLLSALFGTTLAPIAGRYGWKAGIIVGMLHTALVPNTGFIHAGLNLYNNGFAGGFIAATVVPFLDAMEERNEEI